MLKEWSKEQLEERDFEFGGQVFRIRYPHWEDMAEILQRSLEPVETNGDGPAFNFKEDTEYAISKIPLFLEPDYPTKGAHARFKKIVNAKPTATESAIPRHQIIQLFRWLVQETGALPTTPPSGSEPGGGETAISSEEESS